MATNIEGHAAEMLNLQEDDINTIKKRSKQKIVVIGCEEEGLHHALLFAEEGFHVVGADFNQLLISNYLKGKPPFADANLKHTLRKHTKNGRLTFTSNVEKAVSESNIIVVSTPTAFHRKRKPDYSDILKAAKTAGKVLPSGSLVIITSVVEPGVTETIIKKAFERASGLKAGRNFGLAYSPKVASGQVSKRIENCPRIVSGVNDLSLKSTLLLMKTVIKANVLEVEKIRLAEAARIFQSVRSDVNTALAHEFAFFCEKTGVDYFDVEKILNADTDSGACVTRSFNINARKYPYLLLETAENRGFKMRLSSLARSANEKVLTHVIRLTRTALHQCRKTIRRANLAILGVSDTPNSKTFSITCVKTLVETLKSRGAKVRVYDPFFSYRELMKLGFHAENTLTKTLENVDCLIITVEHSNFKRLNLKKARFQVRMPAAIVDVGRAISPVKAEETGFVYLGLGRGVESK